MSAKKTDIAKYLKGELDARPSHKLEREAQDDPFLMDALDGYQNAGKRDVDISDLQARLAQRIAPKKERNLLLWRALPIAACLLIILTVGYWYFTAKPAKQQLANVVQPVNKVQAPVIVQEQQSIETEHPAKRIGKPAENLALAQVPPSSNVAPAAISEDNKIATYKTDTVEYKASDYKVRPGSKVDELLKGMAALKADSNGIILARMPAPTRVRLNGKDFAGGNVQQAEKNLPADIVNKIQVVDDYGDQATRTGVKNGNKGKLLNISTDTISKGLLATSKSQQLKQIANAPLAEVRIAGYGTQTNVTATNNTAYPIVGWAVYNQYLNENAVMSDGSTGVVELGFKVGIDLKLSNIRVINSPDKAMSDKAIEILNNGSKWMTSDPSTETRLKIIFHKKN